MKEPKKLSVDMAPPTDGRNTSVTVGEMTYCRVPGFYGTVRDEHVQALLVKGWTINRSPAR